MSGLEVLGVVLGALPILLKSVDAYRGGIRRVGAAAFRKRKHVEKLARALLLQQQILEETLTSVVLASGCENVSALHENPFGYFSLEEIQEQVVDYLGEKNSMVSVDLVQSSHDTVEKIARNVSGLTPAQKVRAAKARRPSYSSSTSRDAQEYTLNEW